MYSRIIICCFVLLVLSYGSSRAYIEEKFFCTVEKNTIAVSIATGENNCFSYMEQLTQGLESTKKDIAKTEKYITSGVNAGYWQEVQEELITKKYDLEHLRKQFDIAISDYEQELFLKVKGISGYYLMPHRQHIVEKLHKADLLLLRLKLVGDTENYAFVVEQVELLQQQLMLLDRIRYAHTFAELVAPLKLYLNRAGFKVPTTTSLL